jgi:hypothetical protein
MTAVETPTLSVTIRLPTGEEQRLKPVPVRPGARPTLPARELPYDGSATSTAVWLKPSSAKSVVLLLNEGPSNPGPAVGLSAIDVGFPSDGPVTRFEVNGPRGQVSAPCVSRSAFLIDGVGARPRGDILIW